MDAPPPLPHFKMKKTPTLSFSQIAGFIDRQYQYPCKETISALNFLNRDSPQSHRASKSTIVGWA